jgi:hypothetical protein
MTTMCVTVFVPLGPPTPSMESKALSKSKLSNWEKQPQKKKLHRRQLRHGSSQRPWTFYFPTKIRSIVERGEFLTTILHRLCAAS